MQLAGIVLLHHEYAAAGESALSGRLGGEGEVPLLPVGFQGI